MKTTFKKLNYNWNAEPNVARPLCFIEGKDLLVVFELNKYLFPENPEQNIGMLKFADCSRFRVGHVNMDSWYMGNCRFSKLAPKWGDFYQVTGDLLLNKCEDDWVDVFKNNQKTKHYLFYFRDMEFESDAGNWSFEPLDDNKSLKSTSKFLSLILRHKPETIGLKLDENGWLNIEEIIAASKKQGNGINLETILKTVYTNKKNRFSISKGKQHIRANQGHSVNVDIEFSPKKPPDFLYHGTATRFLDSIIEQGILKSGRLHVHLSEDYFTSQDVGSRYGKAIILEVDSLQMYKDGIEFYQSANGVWLTYYVGVGYFKKL